MYSREIDGEILTLAASGWTYLSTFVLYDKETESLWYHFGEGGGLTCISGHYKDRFLRERESIKLRWNRWSELHPDTKYLACKKVNGGCAQPD